MTAVQDHLDALERGCLADAPHLVDHVRALRQALARPVATTAPTLAASLLDAPVDLEDLRSHEEPTVDPAGAARVDRYDDLGIIGTGAMGEVRRVRDRELNRTLAMKVVRVALMHRPQALANGCS